MSRTGSGTTLISGINDENLVGIPIESGGALIFNHGLGTLNGTGGRAASVKVFAYAVGGGVTFGQNMATLTGVGGMSVTQPETGGAGSGVYDVVRVLNEEAGTINIVVEIIWEWGSSELDLITGNLVAPGPTDVPYANAGAPTGRFVFS